MPKTTSTSTREFRVRWEIDLDADSPEDAARQALAIQRDPNSLATIFEVRWRDPDNVNQSYVMTVDASVPEQELAPEPQPDNESERTVNGVRLKAVPRRDPCIECDGCHLFSYNFPSRLCNSPSCIGRERADGTEVIWVRQDA